MRYLSVCSGIEAATVAWRPLGWSAVAFSEIDKFPSAVLTHHYPLTPNLGDMERFHEWPDLDFDLLVGGTPCQSFSVAGLRKGLDDPRGNLALVYLGIADRYRPRWLVWENVPGVLSLDRGRAFGSILGALAQLGYGFAYRVLDAQYDGLAQRRKRVFVVGHLGDWRRAAAVLLEPESLLGNPAPRREAGEGFARPITAGVDGSSGYQLDADTAENLVAYGGNRMSGPIDVATAVNAHGGPHGRLDLESETFVTHSLRADGFDASEDGPGRGTPLVPMAVALRGREGGGTAELSEIPSALRASQGGSDKAHVLQNMTAAGGQVAIALQTAVTPKYGDVAFTLTQPSPTGGGQPQAVMHNMAVRRLTPRECERLQGFPDDYTLIPYTHGKPAKDGPRYKALGNSMAVPVVRWIGARIAAEEELSVLYA